MILVTPSKWLSQMVKQSFMMEYPLKVIYNGIDLNIFKPSPSDFKTRYNIQNKKMILGVAFSWEYRKGIDVFLKLSEQLPNDYVIVLVGTDDSIDAMLSDSIISVHRTKSQKELAEIYSAADLFVNPTREEVLGMVNIEALACGTPVITFDSGGSPECIDNSCGDVIRCDDIEALKTCIVYRCEKAPFNREKCIQRAKCFNSTILYKEYMKLYKNEFKTLE